MKKSCQHTALGIFLQSSLLLVLSSFIYPFNVYFSSAVSEILGRIGSTHPTSSNIRDVSSTYDCYSGLHTLSSLYGTPVLRLWWDSFLDHEEGRETEKFPFLLPSLFFCSFPGPTATLHPVFKTQQVFSCHIRLPASLQVQSSSSCFSFSLYSSSLRVDARNVKAGQYYNHVSTSSVELRKLRPKSSA